MKVPMFQVTTETSPSVRRATTFRPVAAALVACIMPLAYSDATAGLVVGGGFDSQTELTDNWTQGGTIGGTGITIGPAFGLAPQAGAGYLDFSGNDEGADGFVEQTISVDPLAEYDLQFFWGGRGGNGARVTASVTEVIFGDLYEQEFVINQIGVWTSADVRFSPSSSSIILRFQETSNGSNSRDPAIDSVRLTKVTSVPISSSTALLALGLMSLLLATRTRRREGEAQARAI